MNWWSFHHLIKQCGNHRRLQQLHAQTLLRGLHPHRQPLSCQILNAYARLGSATDAYKIFHQIPIPDIVSLTSLISLHLQCSQPYQAISVFSHIISSGLQPDGFAAVGALSASTQLGNLDFGKILHAFIYRHGLGFECVVTNALIDMYSKNGNIRSAESVFADMGFRDSVSWSSMLNGYVRCKGMTHAGKLFDEMPSRDTVSWTVMITGLVQTKQPIEALKLFQQMTAEGHQPTLVTIVGALSACADVGASDLGRAIHGYASKMDGSFDVALHNALIDMYSKCGKLELAEEIFNCVPKKDVYTWTSMISGFAVHGRANKAVDAFSNMLSSCILPNKITFLGVLSACSHGGLVEEGRKLFDSMKRVYNYKPQVEHFGCMVDLLGRAGLLREAELLIQDMDVDADCVIWRSLLSACVIHGDMELAEVTGKKITEIEPGDDSVYVLLWNVHASSQRWKEAAEVRKKMGEMKLLKRPGYSWVEVDGIVHEFLVDDRTSLCETEIYLVLEGMSRHLRMPSYSLLYEEEG